MKAQEDYEAEAELYVDSDSNLSVERMNVDAKFVHRCLHAAETHENQTIRPPAVSEDDNGVRTSLMENVERVVKNDGMNMTTNEPFDDDDEVIDDEDADNLLEYHTEAATETLNLLLPETQPTAALDCSNFLDFDEFNLCLNNMFSDDDVVGGMSPHEFIAEAGLNMTLENALTIQKQQQHPPIIAQSNNQPAKRGKQPRYNEHDDGDGVFMNDDLHLHFMSYDQNDEKYAAHDDDDDDDDDDNAADNSTTTIANRATPTMEILCEARQAVEQSQTSEYFTAAIEGGFVDTDTEGDCSSNSDDTLSYGSGAGSTETSTTTTTVAAATRTIATNHSVTANAVDIISCSSHNVVNIFQ